MVEYNTVDTKLSDSHLNKLKSAVKNKQRTTLIVVNNKTNNQAKKMQLKTICQLI